jgi:hypothetical protein
MPFDSPAEEELWYAQELFAAFKKATPNAPNWYQLANYCISVLMADHVKKLERKVNPLSHEE